MFEKIPKNFNSEIYYYIKSHRSSVTEGNTTSVGEFAILVKERQIGNIQYIVPNKIEDETLEIDNLYKVYQFLSQKKINEYDYTLLNNCHSILGNNVFRNNMVEVRGKLKTQVNYVFFREDGVLYRKYFSHPNDVKQQLNWLFECFREIPDDSISRILVKYIILQVELISIHPYNDGNCRISRAMSE